MKWIALGIVAFTTLLMLAGCDESQSKTGAQQVCVGDLVNCVLNDEVDGSPVVIGVPEVTAGGSTPITTGGGSENPYNCPDDTVIRSDCSQVSQENCVCMLP